MLTFSLKTPMLRPSRMNPAISRLSQPHHEFHSHNLL